jgi:hypothetical protein
MANPIGSHTTWYEVETDIRIMKLYCEYCKEQSLSLVSDETHPCKVCESELEWKHHLTPEQIEVIHGHIADYTHYLSERDEKYDEDDEQDAHAQLEGSLAQYDWWQDDREQCQFMWHKLRDFPWGFPNYFACARRYFEFHYRLAYHRDDYSN